MKEAVKIRYLWWEETISSGLNIVKKIVKPGYLICGLVKPGLKLADPIRHYSVVAQ